MSRYVEQLEKRIEEKDEVIGMLRGELVHRNEEIVRRNERERETNVLIRGLQNATLATLAVASTGFASRNGGQPTIERLCAFGPEICAAVRALSF